MIASLETSAAVFVASDMRSKCGVTAGVREGFSAGVLELSTAPGDGKEWAKVVVSVAAALR